MNISARFPSSVPELRRLCRRLFNRTGLYVQPLFLGMLFFAASLTPTLLPRSWLVQGVLGGIVTASWTA